MGIIRNAVESQKRTQTLSVIAIGFSIVALIVAVAVIGGRNAAR